MVVPPGSGLEGSLDALNAIARKRNKLKENELQPQRRTRPVNRHYFRQTSIRNLKVKPRLSWQYF